MFHAQQRIGGGGLSKKQFKEFQGKLCQFECVTGFFITSDTEDELDDLSETLLHYVENLDSVPFVFEKVKIFKEQGGTGCTDFIEQCHVSVDERGQLESQTRGQGNVWKVNRKGLVTSTKLKEVQTKQHMIEKGTKNPGETLAAKLLENDSMDKFSKLPVQIEYSRTNEHEARKEYHKLMSTMHINFRMVSSGLVICMDDPMIAAGPDGLRSCNCCGTATIEYKCPYTDRYQYPREAFLHKGVGGVSFDDGSYGLDKNHKYYFQVQGQMAATNTILCDFDVFLGILTLDLMGEFLLLKFHSQKNSGMTLERK